MEMQICEECEELTAELCDVVTGAELLAAMEERAAEDQLEFHSQDTHEECLVYLLRCESCSWQSLRSTERVKLVEDPEPIA